MRGVWAHFRCHLEGGNPWYLTKLDAVDQIYNTLSVWQRLKQINVTNMVYGSQFTHRLLRLRIIYVVCGLLPNTLWVFSTRVDHSILLLFFFTCKSMKQYNPVKYWNICRWICLNCSSLCSIAWINAWANFKVGLTYLNQNQYCTQKLRTSHYQISYLSFKLTGA